MSNVAWCWQWWWRCSDLWDLTLCQTLLPTLAELINSRHEKYAVFVSYLLQQFGLFQCRFDKLYLSPPRVECEFSFLTFLKCFDTVGWMRGNDGRNWALIYVHYFYYSDFLMKLFRTKLFAHAGKVSKWNWHSLAYLKLRVHRLNRWTTSVSKLKIISKKYIKKPLKLRSRSNV